MKAVVISSKGGPPAIVTDRPKPRLRPTYIIVRTYAVALNPADVAIVDYGMGETGSLLGCDFAGVIEEVGSEVHRDFKVGDRVCGPTRAGDSTEKENGAFAELICVKADMCMRIPESMGWEDASTFGVTQITTGRCLYQKFGLPWPDKAEPNPGQIFIYGGSSAMGTMLIQFAKLSKYEVITVCSPSNFELCKSYGADHIFDYNEPSTVEKIRHLTKGTLKLCADTICTDKTAAFCGEIIASGGKYSSILFAVCPRDDVESFKTLGYSFLGEEWEQFGKINPASKEDFEYSKGFAALSEKLLAQGKIRPHPVDRRVGGLDAIPAAMDDLRAKRVSGKKIVVRTKE